jgi:replicative DNA helicase
MNHEEVIKFYMNYLKGAKISGSYIKAPCPFCMKNKSKKPGVFAVNINPASYFMGYFRCLNKCMQGGFVSYFGKLLDVDPKVIPGFDPDYEPFAKKISYPSVTVNVSEFTSILQSHNLTFFKEFGVSDQLLKLMKIGFNGKYLVYPYFLENGACYAARYVLPENDDDTFWRGEEKCFKKEFRIFNVEEIERCKDGALFITDSEKGLLALKEIGYPAACVPSHTDLDVFSKEMLAGVKHVFLFVNNSPEAYLSARELATNIGFKVRIIKWPFNMKRGYDICSLATDKATDFGKTISTYITNSKAFSPFVSPQKEFKGFFNSINEKKGIQLLGLSTGFVKMDNALDGIRGINIMGGQPKAGKSCFFIQISTEIARAGIPVIYYDFENGRKQIYTRTICRLGEISAKDLRLEYVEKDKSERISKAFGEFQSLLPNFRVITDRKVTPEIMKRHIDFIQHETRVNKTMIVIDSLHKLPFKNLSERRTGIDFWLRNMEEIRDEQDVTFLVVSELSRGNQGSYSATPDLGAFKDSGDIEYSADNAMIFVPDWDALDPISESKRSSTLWVVASRESSPGKIGNYTLNYPYWGFTEA